MADGLARVFYRVRPSFIVAGLCTRAMRRVCFVGGRGSRRQAQPHPGCSAMADALAKKREEAIAAKEAARKQKAEEIKANKKKLAEKRVRRL